MMEREGKRKGEGGREKPATKKKRIESTNRAEKSDDAKISDGKDTKISSATVTHLSEGDKHNAEVETVKVTDSKSKLADKNKDNLSYRDRFS